MSDCYETARQLFQCCRAARKIKLFVIVVPVALKDCSFRASLISRDGVFLSPLRPMLIGRPLIVQSRDATRVCHSRLPVNVIPPAEIARFRSSIQYRWRRASFCLMAFRFRARALECLAMRWGAFCLLQ
jgi:hypothetical protein